MVYIDQEFYRAEFHGTDIPDDEFARIASAASELVYDICRIKPTPSIVQSTDFKAAVAYQVETLYANGGFDALSGLSASALAGGSESLGDYSVSAGSAERGVATLYRGIPVAPLTLSILRRLGLMSRWVYAGRKYHGKP